MLNSTDDDNNSSAATKRILSLHTRNAGSDCRLGFETRSRLTGTGEHVYRAAGAHGGVDGRTDGDKVTAGRSANGRLRMQRWRRRRQPDTNRAERAKPYTTTVENRKERKKINSKQSKRVFCVNRLEF